MRKAFGVGIAILVLANALWLLESQSRFWFPTSQISLLATLTGIGLWLSPVIAAFLTAVLAPRHKLLIGTTMAIPAAFFMGLSNLAFEALGHTADFPGIRGAALVMGVSLPVGFLLCLVGGIVGYAITKREKHA